jgi:hypothetical protein
MSSASTRAIKSVSAASTKVFEATASPRGPAEVETLRRLSRCTNRAGILPVESSRPSSKTRTLESSEAPRTSEFREGATVFSDWRADMMTVKRAISTSPRP